MWFTYIIKCKDGSFYTGITTDLDRRFKEHKEGHGGKYTVSHPPLKIMFFERFENRSEASKRESQIKGWTRKEKEKLVKLGKF